MSKTASKRYFFGTVVSSKGQLTAIVSVNRTVVHAKYGKRYQRTLKLACHNPQNNYQPGDKVKIIECRPLSKTKHWRIISKA